MCARGTSRTMDDCPIETSKSARRRKKDFMQKENKEIYEAFQNLKTLSNVSSGLNLEKAKWLSFLRENDRYKLLAGDEDIGWCKFVSQPELHLNYSLAARLVGIYETYIKKFGLKEQDLVGLDSNCLFRATTFVNEDNLTEWLEKIRTLSREDFYREVKFGKVDTMKCNHVWKKLTTKTCLLCGEKEYERE